MKRTDLKRGAQTISKQTRTFPLPPQVARIPAAFAVDFVVVFREAVKVHTVELQRLVVAVEDTPINSAQAMRQILSEQ